MNKLSALALAATCSTAWAQTPASNPMPDGSRDMYVGLGAVSAPRYEGAESRKVSALPLLQVQWSNGFFISGTSAGIHLSNDPALEFGPLVALQMRRSEAGTGSGAGGVEPVFVLQPSITKERRATPDNPLAGLEDIHTRLQGGVFLNYFVAPQLRLTSSLLYGSGNARNGALLDLGIQQLAGQLARHHTVSLSGGVTIANRDYNSAFFGVTPAESLRSGYLPYAPAGGLKDVHVGAHWNWALSPSWMLTSNLQATRLMGSAKNSPLVQRPTNLTVSTAIAYRF
jgi:outer membrane scaffolding protein for murein synthesis (MipA/OmpV family)